MSVRLDQVGMDHACATGGRFSTVRAKPVRTPGLSVVFLTSQKARDGDEMAVFALVV